MPAYGKKASAKVAQALHELKTGELRSGSSGQKVTSRKQAIAIGLSEARREGDKVPAEPRGRAAAKKTAAKKTAAKKVAAKKVAAKKVAAKKVAAKKVVAKKATAKKTAAKKAAARKAPARKAAGTRAGARR